MDEQSAAEETSPKKKRWSLPVMSVRTRIVTVIAVVAALGILSVGISVYFVERARILQQVDELLEAHLDQARQLVAQGQPQDPPADGTEPAIVPWTTSTDALRAVVQRISPDDNTGVLGLIDGQPALAPAIALDLDLQDSAGFARHITRVTRSGQPVIGTYSGEGITWRYLAAPITVEGSPEPATVLYTVAYDIDAELAEINVAARVYLIAGAIALVVIAGVGALVSTRLLRPLRQMRETAERVSAQSLSERLPVEGRDDVSELAQTMNDMLDRLDDAVDSQRRLLSDVGHELKTPITIVRGYLEVMQPDDPADVRETQTLAVDELDRMGQLVQDLASAASLHGPSPIVRAPVDVADLQRQVVRKADGIEGAEVEAGPSADVVAMLDGNRITQALLQLTQNAVTHGGGRVVIGSRAQGDDLELWVRDYGPGVPDDAKQKVFDRFHRGDPERGGSGLGLNIVQVIARAHGGAVQVKDAVGGGAVFVIRVPRGSVPTTAHAAPWEELESDIPPRPPLPAHLVED